MKREGWYNMNMKKIFALFLTLLIPLYCIGSTNLDESQTVDIKLRQAPALEVFQANVKGYQWTIKNNAAVLNGSGYSPVMYWATNNTASGIVTASCAWVNQTLGVFRAEFSTSDLNTNGDFIYGVGVTSNDVTIARQGSFLITPDPFAVGAGTVSFSSTINFTLYDYLGVTNGPTVAGSNIIFRSVGTRGQYAIDGIMTGAVDWAQHVVLSQRVNNAEAGIVSNVSAIANVSNEAYNVLAPQQTAISNMVADNRTWIGVNSNQAFTVLPAHIANVSNQAFTTLPLWIANVSNQSFTTLPSWIANVSNQSFVTLPAWIANASNTAATAWGWGNHALIGYLRAGSNVSSLINDAAYTNNTVTNGTVAWALSQFYPSNNPSSFISSNTITAWADSKFYPSNNPSGFITDAAITGLSTTQALHSLQIGSNQLAITGLSTTNANQNTSIANAEAGIVSNVSAILNNSNTLAGVSGRVVNAEAGIVSNVAAILNNSNTLAGVSGRVVNAEAGIVSNVSAILNNSNTLAGVSGRVVNAEAGIVSNVTDIANHSNRTDNPHTVTLQQAANAGQSVTNKYITIGNLVLDSAYSVSHSLLHPTAEGNNLYITTDTNYYSIPTNPTIKMIANATPEFFFTTGTSDDGYYYFAAGTNGYFRFGNMSTERFRIAKTYIDFKGNEATNISTANIGTNNVLQEFTTNLNANTVTAQTNRIARLEMSGNIEGGGNRITNIFEYGYTGAGFSNFVCGITNINSTGYQYMAWYTSSTAMRTNLCPLW